MITSQVQFQIAKFKFRQYQNTTFFRHFAKFNARQIFPLYSSPPWVVSLYMICSVQDEYTEMICTKWLVTISCIRMKATTPHFRESPSIMPT